MTIMLKTLSVAAIIAVTASASFAGSLNTKPDNIVEPEKGVFVPNTGLGIGTPAIIGGVIAAAVVAGLVSSSNNDDAPVDGHGTETAD